MIIMLTCQQQQPVSGSLLEGLSLFICFHNMLWFHLLIIILDVCF